MTITVIRAGPEIKQFPRTGGHKGIGNPFAPDSGPDASPPATRSRTSALRLASFKLRNIVIPVGCLGVMVYFAYHAVHGDHGLYASWGLQARVESLAARRDRLAAIRADLEHKVALMRPESIDPDMLDEQARATLNLAHPNDIIIFRDPQS